jgi:glycosyltransferase involved in cell wall biosynthesis
MSTVSIVIPCFHNEAQLAQTVAGIVETTRPLDVSGVDFQIVLVDDGSKDSTWQVIRTLPKECAIPVVGLRLGRNFGAYRAIVPGLEAATGDAVIVMAADGDDPPRLIPLLVQHWQEGHVLVQAVRTSEARLLSDRVFGGAFYTLLRMLGLRNIPKNGSDFMLADRSVLNRALKRGFRPGNTLIQLYQHSDSAFQIPYTKGKRPGSSWSTMKKTTLFLNSALTALGLSRTLERIIPAEVI